MTVNRNLGGMHRPCPAEAAAGPGGAGEGELLIDTALGGLMKIERQGACAPCLVPPHISYLITNSAEQLGPTTYSVSSPEAIVILYVPGAV